LTLSRLWFILSSLALSLAPSSSRYVVVFSPVPSFARPTIGRLKLTLTGHIEQIRGLAVSSKHTYMFSTGDDKQVKCWDL
ncbi:hypothetical protein HN51_040015, partial [Arachis hypogaea]